MVKYFAIIILIILTSYKILWNNAQFDWSRYSSSIEDSAKKAVLVLSYEVIDMEFNEMSSDSLCEHMERGGFSIWQEKSWAKKPFLIFFHPMRLTGKTNLIVSYPLELATSALFFYPDSTYATSFAIKRGFAYGQLGTEDMDIDTLWFKYRPTFKEKGNFCSGKIRIKKTKYH